MKSNTGFFGSAMSIADVLYFWEISTIEQYLKKELVDEGQYPHLARWYNESMKSQSEFQEIVTKS